MTSSFGAAARGSRQELPAGAACPCGGGSYKSCCAPFLRGDAAPTAEALMRSRFTAFALQDADYLAATWHGSTRPATVDLDPDVRWIALDLHDVRDGRPGDRRGIVEFTAQWTDARTGETGALHERSRFRFAGGRWWYVDGDVG